MKNESQTVLAVSLSQDDEAPLTRAILCSPCEKREEQKRQCDRHLVRLILTQLRDIGSVCVHVQQSTPETWLVVSINQKGAPPEEGRSPAFLKYCSN